jgi:hypothetical protein
VSEMRCVEVKWGDAFIDTCDISIKKAAKLKPVVRSTIGYLVAENSECIILATDKFEKDKKTVHAPMVIPWGMVIDYWEYVDA